MTFVPRPRSGQWCVIKGRCVSDEYRLIYVIGSTPTFVKFHDEEEVLSRVQLGMVEFCGDELACVTVRSQLNLAVRERERIMGKAITEFEDRREAVLRAAREHLRSG